MMELDLKDIECLQDVLHTQLVEFSKTNNFYPKEYVKNFLETLDRANPEGAMETVPDPNNPGNAITRRRDA